MTDSPFPYLNKTVALLEAEDPEFQQAFGRHWHWGYWDNPALASGTVDDYARAGERMSEHFLDVAGLRDGMRVLDAGCGFGGTLAIANARHRGLSLTGLNIDPRQLALARKNLVPESGNVIELVVGDACRPPFADDAFDRVMAVECIFHFPSRRRFFEEAHRLLAPGGLLVVSDFVSAWLVSALPFGLLSRLRGAGQTRQMRAWGEVHTLDGTRRSYREVARRTGFELAYADDITQNVQPTHDILARLTARLGVNVDAEVEDIGVAMKLGLCTYEILVFRRK
jgi:SAM-dependent methyltransferase